MKWTRWTREAIEKVVSQQVSKQSRRKKALGTPEGMTEREHAERDKLYRIYDCGKVVLTYPKKAA